MKIDETKIVVLESAKILKTANAKANGIQGFSVTSKQPTKQMTR